MRLLPPLIITLTLLAPVYGAFGHNEFSDITPATVNTQGFSGLILDVRSAEEFAASHVPGATNIPHTELTAHLASVGATDQPILVYCRSGRRADIALQALRDLGYSRLFHMDGDMLAWQQNGLPVVTGETAK